MDTLHYIHDPLCGWCYAAEPMAELAHESLASSFRFELHAGGLFDKETLSESKRQYIRGADLRIAELTGQTFGAPYLDVLLSNPKTTYDSAAPAAALIAAEELQAGIGLHMLRALQHAHYREGRNLSDPDVLVDVAVSLGLPRNSFATSLAAATGEPARRHIAATRELMRVVGATGFPTFVLQSGTQLLPIAHESYYRLPRGFVKAVLAEKGQVGT